jgi:hypothetical protein
MTAGDGVESFTFDVQRIGRINFRHLGTKETCQIP